MCTLDDLVRNLRLEAFSLQEGWGVVCFYKDFWRKGNELENQSAKINELHLLPYKLSQNHY